LDLRVAQEAGEGPTLAAQLLNADAGRSAEGIPHELPMVTDHDATLTTRANQMPIPPSKQCVGGISTEGAAGGWMKNFGVHFRTGQSIPFNRQLHSSGRHWAIVQGGRRKFSWPGSGTLPLGSTEKPRPMACREAAASRKMKCKSQKLIFFKTLSPKDIANAC
jgi:hypothetical protein